jgi:hypothetical protein
VFNPSDYTTGVSPRPPRLRAGRCRRLLKAQITDWRAMVDSVMVDPAYDGQVFNVAMSDVPERKTDLVAGRYELPSPTGPTTVAVKLTDMLGEEVLIAKRLD